MFYSNVYFRDSHENVRSQTMTKITTFNPLKFCFRSDNIEFIKQTSIWKEGPKSSLKDCIFFNFGYDKPVEFAQMSNGNKGDITMRVKNLSPVTILHFKQELKEKLEAKQSQVVL